MLHSPVHMHKLDGRTAEAQDPNARASSSRTAFRERSLRTGLRTWGRSARRQCNGIMICVLLFIVICPIAQLEVDSKLITLQMALHSSSSDHHRFQLAVVPKNRIFKCSSDHIYVWSGAPSHRYFCISKTPPVKNPIFLIPLAKMLLLMRAFNWLEQLI